MIAHVRPNQFVAPQMSPPEGPHRVLVIDNYDSFTFNLVQALRVLEARVTVARNDAITPAAALDGGFTALVVSPGPGTPSDAGVSMPVIEAFAKAGIPVLGVCLGHQAMAEVFGGRVVRARRPVHGKASAVRHDGRGVFAGLADPVEVGRYHSLIVDPEHLPPGFIVSARTADGEIMGIRHERLGLEGVQFHPESVLTPLGPRMLANFLVSAKRGGGI